MKYTPTELDRMRRAIKRAHEAPSLHTFHPPNPSYGSYMVFDSGYRELPVEEIERQLLTHMMNETTAADLVEHAADVVRKAREDWESQRAQYEAYEAKKSPPFAPVPNVEPKRWWHL